MTNWQETVLKPGQKWSLPIETLSETLSDFVKIAPISDEKYEKKIINWSSSADHKLLEFDNSLFIQVSPRYGMFLTKYQSFLLIIILSRF